MKMTTRRLRMDSYARLMPWLGVFRLVDPLVWLMRASRLQTPDFSGRKCPKCGASTITDGVDEWCSFVGGDTEKACDWSKK